MNEPQFTVHIAGEMIDGVQRCSRCGVLLFDYRAMVAGGGTCQSCDNADPYCKGNTEGSKAGSPKMQGYSLLERRGMLYHERGSRFPEQGNQMTKQPAEQPKPKTNDSRPVVEAAIELLQERSAKGVETYGTKLQPFNGRDFRQDAIEEAADWFLYRVGWHIEEARKRWDSLAMIGKQAEEIKQLTERLAKFEEAAHIIIRDYDQGIDVARWHMHYLRNLIEGDTVGGGLVEQLDAYRSTLESVREYVLAMEEAFRTGDLRSTDGRNNERANQNCEVRVLISRTLSGASHKELSKRRGLIHLLGSHDVDGCDDPGCMACNGRAGG